MSLINKFDVFAFDAYGTLLDVHSAVARNATRIGQNASAVSQLWRTKQLEYTWVRSLITEYKDFYTLTEQALQYALEFHKIDNRELKSDLMKAYETLNAYEEVVPVLQQLKNNNKRTAIFSNGTDNMLQTAMAEAGIEALIDEVISVDDIGIYKTSPKAYAYCAERMSCSSDALCFHSSNGWDIAGAKAFGFHCVWVNRAGFPSEYGDLCADLVVTDLRVLLDG